MTGLSASAPTEALTSSPADPGGVPGDDAKRGKGSRTRDAILTRGLVLACRVGLGGLTIGSLAADAGLSKSGMYAHFGSKEALQLAVLDAAADEFAASVILPALKVARGEDRVRALAEAWIACGRGRQPGGCLFVKASTELDEQPGPVRDRLRELYQELGRSIARMVEGGIAEGQLRRDIDPEQFATDLHGVMLVYYHGHRLLSDPAAEARARTAVDGLLDAARSGQHGPPSPPSAPHVTSSVAPAPSADPSGASA